MSRLKVLARARARRPITASSRGSDRITSAGTALGALRFRAEAPELELMRKFPRRVWRGGALLDILCTIRSLIGGFAAEMSGI